MATKLSDLEMRFGGNLTPNGMKDIDYKDQNVHFLRFAGASCPICGHRSWCQVNALVLRLSVKELSKQPNPLMDLSMSRILKR